MLQLDCITLFQADKITDQCKNVEVQVKETEASVRELIANPTNNEAKDQLGALQVTVDSLQQKLTQLSQNTVVVSPEEKMKINTEHAKLLSAYRKRKRLCMDIIDAIMEGYPKSKRVLMEEIGIETDEEVKMPIIV